MEKWLLIEHKHTDRNLSYGDKLKNFPSVNYISLNESENRRKFMQFQFDYFGITNTSVYKTERYTEISDYVICAGDVNNIVKSQLGTIISHLNLLRNWYVSTKEEYAIFCEDDVSFESIIYWNFTWDEFLQYLPDNWQCVQLSRVVAPCGSDGHNDLKLKLKPGRWWGSYSLIKRDYVKKILDRTCIGYNKYQLDTIQSDIEYEPIIENLLYIGLGLAYNFPLLIENPNLSTTFLSKHQNKSQEWSHYFILKEWKNYGRTLDLKNAMTLEY